MSPEPDKKAGATRPETPPLNLDFALPPVAERLRLPVIPFAGRVVALDSGPEVLRAVYSTNTAKTPATGVLLCSGLAAGGFSDFVTAMEARVLGGGFAEGTLRFNPTGHGDDLSAALPGFTVSAGVRDVTSGVEFLRARGASTVTVVASSFGAQSALLAAAQGAAIDKIVCRSGVADCFASRLALLPESHVKRAEVAGKLMYPIGGNLVTLDYAFIEDLMRWVPQLPTLYSRIRVPTVFIHGTADQDVPLADTVAAAESIPAKYRAFHPIDGADHGFRGEHHQALHVSMILRELM